ncbi:MAG TPA: outer membrane beta-barrel protein [Ferruginibacter sp.]|nr:outer membrane beta-barrel protein [Ferruginibacter sp.]HNP00202.1 outer membrane beta-barrel protein [Ferruginibacter sp.]
MKAIVLVSILFVCTETLAQYNGRLQVFIEPAGMRASNLKQSLFFTEYKVLDSAGGVFKRSHAELSQEITSKITPGITAGLRYSYPLTGFITINAGINISTYNTERTIAIKGSVTDSSIIVLAGSGPTWTDPSNGYILQWISGGSPWGTMFNTSGVIIVNQQLQRNTFRHTGFGTEKMNLSMLEIPVGVTVTPRNSKFFLNAEISPGLALKSSASVTYKKTSETSYPESPSYTFNMMQWRIGAGVGYRINQSFETSLNYKYFLRSMLHEEDTKLSAIGLQLRYILPLKKQP